MNAKRFVLAGLLALACAVGLPAQGYQLHPGDVVIADTDGNPSFAGAVRVLRQGTGVVEDLAKGGPLQFCSDIVIDRDGAVLVSNWAGQFSQDNGIYRIDPQTSAVTKLNNFPLQDNFQFIRDGNGDLVVADGFNGLARINEFGDVIDFSPSSVQFDTNIGIVLDYDGTYIVAEAPNYFMNNPPPGRLHRVTPAGVRSLFFRDNRVPNPNGLAMEFDGSILVTNAFDGFPQQRGLLRVLRNSTFQELINGLPLDFPSDVEVARPGVYAIADPGTESVVARKPGGMVHTVVSEFDDNNPTNGKPVDRPFGMAFVPRLWLTTPLQVSPGQSVELIVRGRPNKDVQLYVSRRSGPTPLSQRWAGDVRTSHVDLTQATVVRGRSDAAGEARIQIQIPSWQGLRGKALHVQALMPGPRDLSNYVALPVR